MQVIEKFLDLQNALLEKGNNDGIYYPEFMAAMTWCFSPHTDLHKNYFNMTREEIMKKFTGNDEWRKPENLKVGSLVDVRVKLDGHDYGLVTNEDEEKRTKETKQKAKKSNKLPSPKGKAKSNQQIEKDKKDQTQ